MGGTLRGPNSRSRSERSTVSLAARLRMVEENVELRNSGGPVRQNGGHSKGPQRPQRSPRFRSGRNAESRRTLRLWLLFGSLECALMANSEGEISENRDGVGDARRVRQCGSGELESVRFDVKHPPEPP